MLPGVEEPESVLPVLEPEPMLPLLEPEPMLPGVVESVLPVLEPEPMLPGVVCVPVWLPVLEPEPMLPADPVLEPLPEVWAKAIVPMERVAIKSSLRICKFLPGIVGGRLSRPVLNP